MKIVRLEIHPLVVGLEKPFVISLGPFDTARNIGVKAITDSGLTGFGECSPFMTINGESMESAMHMGRYLGKALLGKDPRNPEDWTQTMDGVMHGNTSIKSAFDIALHDLAAQDAGLPLYAWLGGQNNKEMHTDYTVSMDSPDKMAADALDIARKGFGVIKVKLGSTPALDIMRIKSIRQAIGPDIPLRLDANQGWSIPQAADLLKSLHPYNIQYCEEPISRDEFDRLPLLRKQIKIPIMADESCLDHHDARRLIALNACDMFNLKLGKSGGIHKAMKIARLAAEAGMPMQVGGFLESRLAFTASAHLALSNKYIHYYDFDSPLMMLQDPVSGGLRYGSGGSVAMTDAPGLGATIKEEFMLSPDRIVIE